VQGQRSDLSGNPLKLPTWLKWLKTKGIDKETPLKHFRALGWLKSDVHVSLNTGEYEWYTPGEYVEAAKTVMGVIDVDPASSDVANETVKAKKFYTSDNTGLDKKWAGNVWMNPPYSQPLVSLFCAAFAEKLDAGEIKQGCVLINNITETSIGQNLMKLCSTVCFPAGRIKFLDKNNEPLGAPLQGQMILYFGDKAKLFIKQFSQFGVCFKRWNEAK